MNDKELAVKVAGLLGYRIIADCWWEHPDNTDNQIKDSELCQFIFSWPTTGLIMEKMDSLGWEIVWKRKTVWFIEADKEDFEMSGIYDTKEHGYHKAISLAFIEAMEIIERNKHE